MKKLLDHPAGVRGFIHREADIGPPDMDDEYGYKCDVRIFPSHTLDKKATHLSVTKDAGFYDIPVPPWFVAAWHAGEPLNGLFDWLLENRAEEYPWLAELIEQIEWPVGVSDAEQ